MRWWDKLRLRLNSLLRRNHVEDALCEEFSFHLDEQIAENIAAGMEPKEARYAALRALGGAAQMQEECRDQRGVRAIENLHQDVRYAMRGLRKNPGFTAVSVLSLALGIGANTAIFSLLDSVLLQSLPVRDPLRLMFMGTKPTKVGGSIRVSQAFDDRVLAAVQRHAKLLDGASGVQNAYQLSVQVSDRPEIAAGDFVEGTYFRLLGVSPLFGRVLSPADDRPEGITGQGWPVVISYGYWQRRFAGHHDVVGQKLTVNTIPFVIVGVLSAEFRGLQPGEETQLVMPLAAAQQVSEGTIATSSKPQVIGAFLVRLKPGVTSDAAEAELTPLVRETLAAESGTIAVTGNLNQLAVQLTPASRGQDGLRQRFSTALTVLMTVVGLVLLIACANIANLLLARAGARRKEIAIRLSLGCTRWRLARQLLIESLLLSTLGGAIGVVFAVWARNFVVRLATASDVSATQMPIVWDWRLLSFTVAVCVITALLFGVVPALRATSLEPGEVMKSGRTSRLSGRVPLSKTLVAAQVAISLVLLIGAALFLGTLRNLYRVQLGYNAQHLLLMTINPHLAGYEPGRAAQFFDLALQRIQAMPQVESATWAQNVILGHSVGLRPLRVPGYVPKPGERANPWVLTYPVGPGFFHMMEMPLAAGREFTAQDRRGVPLVAMMNQAMARHFFGRANPVGQKISLVGTPQMEVVGIARDAKYLSVRDENEEVLFLPVLQEDPPMPWATLMIRTAPGSTRSAADFSQAIHAIDSNVPVYDLTSMERQRDTKVSRERTLAVLTGFFSLLALGLSAVGLYGVLAYNVAQRTSEIGIRMALGADRGRVLRLICAETAKVVGAGIAGGVATSFAAARLVRSVLFGLTPTNVPAVAFAVLLLAIVALIAALLPARRAMRIDPMVALRYE